MPGLGGASLLGDVPCVLSHAFVGGPHAFVGGLRTVHTAPLGQTSSKLVPGLLWMRPQAPLPFTNFNFYPFSMLSRFSRVQLFSTLWI